MAGNFIKCPRCELNYIDKTKQTYCDVCLAELKLGPSLKFADLEDDEDLEALELCPICKQNYIKYNEDMCEDCKKEKLFEKDDTNLEDDEGWKEYVDESEPVTDDDDTLSLSQLEEEEESEFYDDEDDLDFDNDLDALDDDFDESDDDSTYDDDEDEEEDDEDDE
jgi:hypothetical protein